MKVSVLIPAYNEEETIGRIVKDIDRLFSRHYKYYEIIVIDDSSTDNTLKICRQLAKGLRSLRVYSNKRNMGKTHSVMRGFRITDADIISFIDADYQYSPQDLIKVIASVQNGSDICCGNRKQRYDSVYRKMLSKGFNMFNRVMFGIRVDDVNCGLKAFRKGVMDRINLKYLDAPWFIDTETLTRAYREGMRVTQVDIDHSHRKTGKSKINTLSVVKETVYHGILLKLEYLRGGR